MTFCRMLLYVVLAAASNDFLFLAWCESTFFFRFSFCLSCLRQKLRRHHGLSCCALIVSTLRYDPFVPGVFF